MPDLRCLLSLTFLLSVRTATAQSVVHAPPLPPVTPQVITHGSRTDKVVALTFDACQTHKMSGYDSKIIGILRATHTPATLVLGGRWMETHAAAARSLGADPLFEIGNHSYLHPHMKTLTAAAMRQELQETQDVQYRLMGHQGRLFRPPYGEYNPTLVSEAARMGLKTLTWEVVTGDPDPHVTAPDIVRTVLARTHPGSVVIMHVNGRGWHTAEALPAVIRGLHKRGYRFVTVSQLR